MLIHSQDGIAGREQFKKPLNSRKANQMLIETLTVDSILEQLKQSVKLNPVLRNEPVESLARTAERIEKSVGKIGGKLGEGEYIKVGDQYKRIANVCQSASWSGSDSVGWHGSVMVQFGDGSYYLSDGSVDLSSGSLDSPESFEVRLTGELKLGWCWKFHEYAGASRGVYFQVPMRVWEVVNQLDNRVFDD